MILGIEALNCEDVIFMTDRLYVKVSLLKRSHNVIKTGRKCKFWNVTLFLSKAKKSLVPKKKSTLIFSNGAASKKELAKWRKIYKIFLDFSLWRNCAVVHYSILHYFSIFIPLWDPALFFWNPPSIGIHHDDQI